MKFNEIINLILEHVDDREYLKHKYSLRIGDIIVLDKRAENKKHIVRGLKWHSKNGYEVYSLPLEDVGYNIEQLQNISNTWIDWDKTNELFNQVKNLPQKERIEIARMLDI